MQQWLTANFPSGPDGQVIVFETADLAVGVDPVAQTAAGGIFATVASDNPPTYAALSALACASQGWQQVFDAWKEKGLVS